MADTTEEWVQFRRNGYWHLDTGQHEHEWPYPTVFACGIRRAVRSAHTCSGRPGERLCKLCLMVVEGRLKEATPLEEQP